MPEECRNISSMKKDIPLVFYHYIHEKLWESSNHGVINKREAINCLGWWRMSKNIRPLIIRELEILKLIEVSRYEIKVMRPVDTDSFLKRVYSELEIF